MSQERDCAKEAECNLWLQRLSKLTCDSACGLAPHKPLLLLVVLDLIEEGQLADRLLQRNGDIAFRFSSYWTVVADRRRTKPDVRLPFFRMRTDGFWNLFDETGAAAPERNSAISAQIDVSFLRCASDREFRTLARRTLITKYVDAIERRSLYELVALAIPPDDVVLADATRFDSSKDGKMRRDAKFAVRVLPAYDYNCALTRYRMIAVDGTTALDAAHVQQLRMGGSNHPTNGIALSKTAHWLFDKGFWSISDDFRVLVAADSFEEAGESELLLKHWADSEILLPRNQGMWPDHSCLYWHRKKHGFR